MEARGKDNDDHGDEKYSDDEDQIGDADAIDIVGALDGQQVGHVPY